MQSQQSYCHPTLNLSSLYISPLERCNLNCKICYTQKNSTQLTYKEILQFIEKCQEELFLETVTFCGGEVFLLSWFCDLVNSLAKKNLMIEIITNGTINQLANIDNPNLVNLIISFDGMAAAHDRNRGKGKFEQSWQFLLSARKLGFHFEIFSVVTQHNFGQITQFEGWLQQELGQLPEITYHPRKNKRYLEKHPVSNILGDFEQFGFLDEKQLCWLYNNKKVFPPKNLGCHQLSVMSDGQVYACCEGFSSLGKIDDPIHKIIKNYQRALSKITNAVEYISSGLSQKCDLVCVEPDFVCGLVKE